MNIATRPTTGAQAVTETLEGLGITHVFGLPGTQNVVLYDALRQSHLRFVTATNEMAATFMAGGYFRASGKVAVALTIPGPGFTFALTALAEASHDSAALLYITTRASYDSRLKYRLQVIDQRKMAEPVVKRVFTISHHQDLQKTLVEAYQAALEGEPGPVMVEIELPVLRATVETPREPVFPPEPQPPLNHAQVRDVARLLGKAPKVCLYVGQGAAGAAEEVQRLAELLLCPVFTTLSGRGVLAEDHPLSFYCDYAFGISATATEVLHSAELILAIGCKFTHNGSAGFRLNLPQEKLVHVDRSADVVGANYPSRLAVVADAKEFLSALLAQQAEFATRTSAYTAAEIGRLRQVQQTEQLAQISGEPKVAGSQARTCADLFAELRQALPRHAILVTDSGLHQLLARTYFPVLSPRGMITPADFQSMAFGLPTAIAAAIAEPDRPVVAVIGDGASLMTATELLTAVKEELNLTITVLVDGQYGLIRLQQYSAFGHSAATELRLPDFELLAQAMGISYFLYGEGETRPWQSALYHKGVSLIEVRLSDSLALHSLRLKSASRETVRKALGPRLLQRIKGWFRR